MSETRVPRFRAVPMTAFHGDTAWVVVDVATDTDTYYAEDQRDAEREALFQNLFVASVPADAVCITDRIER